MGWLMAAGAALALGLFGYLVFALLFPEKLS
jgi:K+-transporting ATPase KdpF subunit